MKLKISAPAHVKYKWYPMPDEEEECYGTDPEYSELTSISELKTLHGVSASLGEEEFTQYFWPEHEYLRNNVSNGYLIFEFNEKDKKLYSTVRYDVKEKLPKEELKKLIRYTVGQWGDGVGEGFEQSPVEKHGNEYYLSAWFNGQPEPTAEYII